MSHRQKKTLSILNAENKINRIDDPKFYYKCYVPLEKCDFSKYLPDKFGGKKVLRDSSSRKQLNLEKLDTSLINSNRNKNDNIMVRGIQQINEASVFGTGKRNSLAPLKLKVDFVGDFKKGYLESPEINERKVLRVRKKVDYREERSSGTPNISLQPSQGNKVPIYRKVNCDSPKSRRRKGDLYDFVPESDDDKDSDVSFNIPIKKKKIDNHFISYKKTGTCLKKTKAIGRAVVKYDEKINGIMNKFTSKIKDKKNDQKGKTECLGKITKPENQIRFDDKSIRQLVFNSTMLPVPEKIISPNQSIISRAYKEKELPEINILDYESRECIPASENSSFNTEIDSNSNQCSHNSHYDMSVRSFEEDIENLFGFCDRVQGDKGQKTAGNIQILQNIMLNHSNPSHPYISTPTRPREQKSWRFDTKVVNRNPHFISIKKNSLPSLNQEPVLDHTFDERINVVNNTILVPAAKKAPRQQSILNFLDTDKDYPEICTYSQSLYDIGELSPIKKKKDTEKENSPHKVVINNGKRGAKRNILGEICDFNEENTSSVRKNKDSDKSNKLSSPDDNFKQQESFGFSSSSDMIETEQLNEKKAKPFRIEFTYKNSKKNNDLLEKIKQPVRDSEVRRLIEDDPGFDDVVNQDGLDCGYMGLFEDIQESPKPIRTKPHNKKKTEENHKNKPNEPKLSKEALKWIKEFNEMCDEVDHEQLEID